MKETGLYKKYHVVKVNNPEKVIDAIVLEFDDPIARVGIHAWAHEMLDKDFVECGLDTLKKLDGFPYVTSCTARMSATIVDQLAKIDKLESELAFARKVADSKGATVTRMESGLLFYAAEGNWGCLVDSRDETVAFITDEDTSEYGNGCKKGGEMARRALGISEEKNPHTAPDKG